MLVKKAPCPLPAGSEQLVVDRLIDLIHLVQGMHWLLDRESAYVDALAFGQFTSERMNELSWNACFREHVWFRALKESGHA